MNNLPANPELVVVTARPAVFRAEDRNDARFYIFATLANGVLRFEAVAKLSSGERGAVAGKDFFAAMMAHFGARVTTIEANWESATGLTTNIDLLNHATAAGLTVEEAASLTWTGLRASEYGYDKLKVVQALPQGAQGNYDSVRVRFGL